MSDLRERMIQAHGGRQRWLEVARVMANLDMGGWEFFQHLQPRPFRDVEVSVDTRSRRVTFTPFPRSGEVGIFEPERVRIEDRSGEVLQDRTSPGAVTRSPRHWLVWDNLDLLYVAGVTVWQALLLPFLLAREGVVDEPLAAVPGVDRPVDRIDVSFPDDQPLPALRQVVYADRTGIVNRIDYSPAAYGGLIRVGQVLSRHEVFEGRVLACRQTLYPCLPAGALWRPTRLCWLALDDVSITAAQSLRGNASS